MSNSNSEGSAEWRALGLPHKGRGRFKARRQQSLEFESTLPP